MQDRRSEPLDDLQLDHCACRLTTKAFHVHKVGDSHVYVSNRPGGPVDVQYLCAESKRTIRPFHVTAGACKAEAGDNDGGFAAHNAEWRNFYGPFRLVDR